VSTTAQIRSHSTFTPLSRHINPGTHHKPDRIVHQRHSPTGSSERKYIKKRRNREETIKEKSNPQKMAPCLSGEEIDDLVYFARAGEDADLVEMLRDLAARDAATPANILAAARDERGKATCLHMAAANGHASK
jgi:hypothetical protein